MKLRSNLVLMMVIIATFLVVFPSCRDAEKSVSAQQAGTIIILHGISSAGKTSTAKQIQGLMNDPYAYVGIDSLNTMLPEWLVNFNPATATITSKVKQDGLSFEPTTVNGEQILIVKVGVFAKRYFMLIPEIIATFAGNGFNCITDIGFAAADQKSNEDSLKKYVKDLHGYKVYFINLTVSPEVAAQREQARGGFKGLAAGQQYSMLKSLTPQSFDLEIDTSELSPEQIAQEIVEFMKSHKEPQAFNNLYNHYF